MKDKFKKNTIVIEGDFFDNTKSMNHTDIIYYLDIDKSRKKAPRLKALLDKVIINDKEEQEHGSIN